jgi:hypothetical protein
MKFNFSTASNATASISRTKLFKQIVPSESIRERLIRLGIEKKKLNLEQKIEQKNALNTEKIVIILDFLSYSLITFFRFQVECI